MNKVVGWGWFKGVVRWGRGLYIKGKGIVDLGKLEEMVGEVWEDLGVGLGGGRGKGV